MKKLMICGFVAASLLSPVWVSSYAQSRVIPTATPIPVEGKLPYNQYVGGDDPGSYFGWTARP